MAEMITSDRSAKKSRRKLASIHVDMTPMVDLAFLLISFFMLTTVFSKPMVMDLGLPAKGPIPENVVIDTKNSINFIIGKDNRVFYHQNEIKDLNASTMKETSLAGNDILKVIADAKRNAKDQEKFTIIIKPTDDANYKNFVDMLDNMVITNNERYGITDAKPKELEVYRTLIK